MKIVDHAINHLSLTGAVLKHAPSLAVPSTSLRTGGAQIGRSLTVAALTSFVLCFGLPMGSLWAQVGATGPEHPVTISRGTGRVQNCGKNFDCFTKAFDEGRAVRVEQVRTGLYDGMLNSATVSFEFSNFTPETVVYYIKWEDYRLQFTEEGRQQALRQGISGDALARKEKEAEEMQKSFKSRDGACLFQRAVVREFLERWSKGELSLTDYKSAEKCEGKAVAFPP